MAVMAFNGNRRIPKNYQGRKPTGRQIKDLLNPLLNELQERVKTQPADVINAWPELIGEKIASMTEAVSFQSGVLVVKVSNSALYSLLVSHEKRRIEGLLKSCFPTLTINKIQFRIR
ncbi:hypothetical protein COB11_00845 [Candidatus Aerophobetes bacterium]|uniref:DUF721 domain-containing protein n=1 Tax=Aerophobetes bacterium TaxID=2030807 RepID=A0A2A4YMQ4_UNCAE|nr:MAG: hypothetical protein COB11_00845 [Candidatus Aerophobetes bacterium]